VASTLLAPGVPPDYYERMFEAELEDWWYTGMRGITVAVLGEHLRRPGLRLLDAGCGTGGFLRFALDYGSLGGASGVDVSATAVEYARRRVPEADLRVAPLVELPFEGKFDLVVTNDVLQHIPEAEVTRSLEELRRMLEPDGLLFVRTNGSRRARRERHDWRAYDRASLASELERAGFECRRITYGNMLLSAWAAAAGRSPRAPTEERHGLPVRRSSRTKSAIASALLRAEAAYLSRPAAQLPFGHTLLALARPARGAVAGD
jgi:SAM-dependent methyltransferase